MMINQGVGVKKVTQPAQKSLEIHNGEEAEMVENGDGDLLDKVERHINSAAGPDGAVENRVAGHEDVQMQDEQEQDNSEIILLNTIVEEMYDRFNDADIKEILQICGEVLSGSEVSEDEMHLRHG